MTQEIKEKLINEELPCWETRSSIKEARASGQNSAAESAKEDWKDILALPGDLKMGTYEYEKSNFPEGTFMQEDEEWEKFYNIFDGKKEFTVEFVIEKALVYQEAFNMLIDEISLLGRDGYFD